MNPVAISTTTVPGVPTWVIGAQGAQQAWDLYSRSRSLAWEALLLFALIAYLLHVFGTFNSPKESWDQPLGRIVVAAILLSAFPLEMKVIFGTGNYIGQRLFSAEEAQTLAMNTHDAAQDMLNQPELPDHPPPAKSWLQRLAGIIKRIAPGQRLITEVVLGGISIFFFLVVGLMAALWRCLVVIIFVVSPLLIVMSVLPGIGGRIAGAWIASLVELSFWQVVTAILAALVYHTDEFLDPNSSISDFPAIFFALAYALLYLMLPLLVNWMLPISSVSTVASSALERAADFSSHVARGVVHVAQRPAARDTRRGKRAA